MILFSLREKIIEKSAISQLTNQFKIERMKGSNHLTGLVILVFIIAVSFVNCWPVQVKAQNVKIKNQVSKEAFIPNLIVMIIDGQRWQETFTGVDDGRRDGNLVNHPWPLSERSFDMPVKLSTEELRMPGYGITLWR